MSCVTTSPDRRLGFVHVRLVSFSDDQPRSNYANKSGGTSPQAEEERQESFVVITQFNQTVTFTHARSYFRWDTCPSRFVSEIPLVGGRVSSERSNI